MTRSTEGRHWIAPVVVTIVVSIVGRDVLPHVAHRFGEMEKLMQEDNS